MIKSFKLTNFYSVGDTQEICFEISAKDKLDDSSAQFSDKYINLVNCFIGHNASGKTTILKAITFLFWLINNSYTSTKVGDFIPVVSHKLFENKTTKIEIEFFNQETFFQYRIELDRHHIQNEYLGKKFQRAYTKIFEYNRIDDDWRFEAPKFSINKNDLARFKERKNVSVLSSLIETGYLPDLFFLKNFKSNLTNMGHFSQHPFTVFLDVSSSLFTDEELQKEALFFVKDIDIGVTDFDFSEAAFVRKNNEKLDESEKKHILELVHKTKNGKFKLPFIEESNGTQHSISLYSKVRSILKTGGVVILDEIESGLHPYVAKKIISLFENPKTNPNKAQLVFSTHQHLLLNDRTKTQIFIVEKEGKKFESEIFRLDEVEGIRNDENFFQKYLAGAYGGIPQIKWVRV